MSFTRALLRGEMLQCWTGRQSKNKRLTMSESIYDRTLVGSGQTSMSKNSIPNACLSFHGFMTLYIASVLVVIPIRVPT
jgi:hypothetical protein